MEAKRGGLFWSVACVYADRRRDILNRALQFGSGENLQPTLDSAFRSSVIKPPADDNCRCGEHGKGEDSNRDCGHTNLLPDKAECRGGG